MNKVLSSCAALLTLFVAVESRICNTCQLSIFGTCIPGDPINCPANQTTCFNSVAKFSADILPIHVRGCTNESACVNETNQSILTFEYNITTFCCNKAHCNGATSAQLSLATALSAALVAVWSQWCL